MFTYKLLAGFSSLGLVATAAAPVDPWTALASGGVCAVLLGICLLRLIPNMIEKHAATAAEQAAAQKYAADKFETATKELAECHGRDCDKIAAEISAGNKEVSTLLRQALFNRDTDGMT